MSTEVLALGDMGATNTRLVIMNMRGQMLAEEYSPTNVGDYQGTMDNVAAVWERMADGRRILAASLAIAATPDETGKLVESGDLSPWIGNRPGATIGNLMNMPVGLMNDVVAIARSQAYVDKRNGHMVDGYASALSSGFGGAAYFSDGRFKGDEPGHKFLREGATCPCGGKGHMEAWISGKGVAKNHDGTPLVEWVIAPENAEKLTADITTAMILTLERQKSENDFAPDEWRWTGGVALNQSFIMWDAAERVQAQLGKNAPLIDTITMGEKAGLHGTFVDARELARAA